MTTAWHIAQLNIAAALYPIDDERMSRFVEQLDDINTLADNSPGFIWRLQSKSSNATDILVDDDPMLIVNMSVWRDVEALFDFATRAPIVRSLPIVADGSNGRTVRTRCCGG